METRTTQTTVHRPGPTPKHSPVQNVSSTKPSSSCLPQTSFLYMDSPGGQFQLLESFSTWTQILLFKAVGLFVYLFIAKAKTEEEARTKPCFLGTRASVQSTWHFWNSSVRELYLPFPSVAAEGCYWYYAPGCNLILSCLFHHFGHRTHHITVFNSLL